MRWVNGIPKTQRPKKNGSNWQILTQRALYEVHVFFCLEWGWRTEVVKKHLLQVLEFRYNHIRHFAGFDQASLVQENIYCPSTLTGILECLIIILMKHNLWLPEIAMASLKSVHWCRNWNIKFIFCSFEIATPLVFCSALKFVELHRKSSGAQVVIFVLNVIVFLLSSFPLPNIKHTERKKIPDIGSTSPKYMKLYFRT